MPKDFQIPIYCPARLKTQYERFKLIMKKRNELYAQESLESVSSFFVKRMLEYIKNNEHLLGGAAAVESTKIEEDMNVRLDKMEKMLLKQNEVLVKLGKKKK